MFDVLLRRRAGFCGASDRLIWLTSLCLLSACAANSGATYADVASARAGREPGVASERRARSIAIQGSTLDRAQFVRAVLEQNPSLESGRQAVRAAAARGRQAGVFDDPMVDLGLAPLSLGSSKAPVGYEVTLSQRLPWFGKRALEATQANAETAAAQSDFEAMRLDLALAAVALYDRYYVAVRSLEINAHHVQLMTVMQDAANAQLESGRGSALDSLQAEAELAHMEHDTVKLASERDVTVAQMNELLHRAPELPLPPPPSSLPAASSTDSLSAPALEQQALDASPELLATRQRARAEQARADRAGRDAYPDFTVSASYNSMWDMPEHRFMLGLGFNLPLQSGRRQGTADEAQAMRAQLESEALRLTDAARVRVFVLLKELQESVHVLRLYETRLLPVARKQIEQARAGFATARNPFLAVLEAERSLRGLELEHQTALAEHFRRRAELDRALGRVPGLTGSEERR